MPTYSYRCTECGTAFDIQQAFTDDSLTECPTCSGRLRKLFSAVGVTFNGSGFYRNDSRSGASSGGSPSGGSSSGGSSSGGSASGGSSDSSGSSSPASAPAPAAASTTSASTD